VELRWTANGYLMGRVQGGLKFKQFLGTKEDLTARTYMVKKMDVDYFDEEEE
jgi:hypothetical protein